MIPIFEFWKLDVKNYLRYRITIYTWEQTDRRTNTQSDRQTSFDSSDWVGLEKIYYDGGLELYGNIYVWSIFILRLVLNWTSHHHQDGVLVLLLQWNVNRFYYTSWQIHSLKLTIRTASSSSIVWLIPKRINTIGKVNQLIDINK